MKRNELVKSVIHIYVVFSVISTGLYVSNIGYQTTTDAFNTYIVEADGIDTITITKLLTNTDLDSTIFYFSIGKGTSMKPLITKCDVIIYDNTRFKEVDKGDIIAYEDELNNRVVVHKYLGNQTAKGINNGHKDMVRVTAENYRKKVYMVIDIDKNICQ